MTQTIGAIKPSKVRRLPGTRSVRRALEEFFRERGGMKGEMEVKIVDDLVLLRCKGAVSPAEVDLATMKAGRLLLREVTERHCQELQPDLSRLLREITGYRVADICVAIFFGRREKIYLFTMSGRVKQ
jgi:uncharacterized protein YbcI